MEGGSHPEKRGTVRTTNGTESYRRMWGRKETMVLKSENIEAGVQSNNNSKELECEIRLDPL